MQLTNEEDLLNTVLHAPIGICILDADTLVAEIVNDKFLEVAGKPYKAIFGKFYWDAFAEARIYYEAALAAVVQTGESYYANEVELMLIRHGVEEMVFVTFVYAPVKNADGRVAKVAVWVLENTRQVHERQKVEAARAAFQRERDRLKSFFMQAPAGICILAGPKLVYELVNPGYQELLPGRKLLNRPIFEAMPELVGTPLQEVLLNVYRTGEPYEINELLIPVAEYEGGPTKDRYFSFNYQARRDENDEVDGILVFVFEVTSMMNVQKDQLAMNEELSAANEELSSGQEGLQEINDQLAASEHRTRRIVENAPFPIAVYTGREMRISLANQAIIDVWGKGQDVIGKLYTEILPELDDQSVFTQLDAVFTSGRAFHARNQRIDLVVNGRMKTSYFNYSFTALTNQEGSIYGVMNTAADVTDAVLAREALAAINKQMSASNEELLSANEELAAVNEELHTTNEELTETQAALREINESLAESESRFRRLVQEAPVAICIFKGRGLLIEAANDDMRQLWGKSADVIGKTFVAAVPEIEGQPFIQLLETVFDTGEIYYGNESQATINRDGVLTDSYFNFIYQPIKDERDVTEAIMVVATDVTGQVAERKKAERAEESMRLAVDAAGLGTYFINATDRIFHPSPRLKEFFGFKPDEEVPYEAAINQIHPDYRQKAADMVEAAFTKGERFDLEYPVVGYHDGSIRWVRGLGTMQRYDGKDFFTGVLHDITEKKQDEIRKNDFIAMVSHELKTPLTSLTAIVQVLNAKFKNSDDAFVPGALSNASLQVKRMSNMINGFLNISRLESGKILIEKQSFDIDRLLREMIAETQMTVTTHELNFAGCGELEVYADRDKISSVISNLISNAVKYSPKGKTIGVKCQAFGKTVRVSVQDEGMGIKPADKEKVFNRYFRVETSHTKHISGFGIGLYLSAEIIQRHDGKIWVESENGMGSTFYFSLPLTVKS